MTSFTLEKTQKTTGKKIDFSMVVEDNLTKEEKEQAAIKRIKDIESKGFNIVGVWRVFGDCGLVCKIKINNN